MHSLHITISITLFTRYWNSADIQNAFLCNNAELRRRQQSTMMKRELQYSQRHLAQPAYNASMLSGMWEHPCHNRHFVSQSLVPDVRSLLQRLDLTYLTALADSMLITNHAYMPQPTESVRTSVNHY